MMRRPLPIVMITLALTLLAGCGFQLRGLNQPGLELPTVALSANVSPFSEVTRDALDTAGARVSDDAELRVNLGDERIREDRLTGVDSGSRETRVTLTAPFSVQRVADGAYLLNQEQLEASTTVLLSTDDIYSGNQLRQEAIMELRQQAANQLVRRLSALETP